MKNKEENMQPTAFLKICLSGNDKSYYLWNNAQKYYDKLNHALEDIKEEEQPASYLISVLYRCHLQLWNIP